MGYLDVDNEKDTSNLRDEEVLTLSLENPEHFGILVDRYQAAFLRNVRKVLGNRLEIEDVVQEVFTKIYVNAKRFHRVEGAKFSSWAYKILFNTSFTYYKKLKRVGEREIAIDDEMLALAPDLSIEDIGSTGLRDEVAVVLSRMPTHLARILKLQFLDDKSQDTIAEAEGLSVSAVKTRVHRAKKEFKKTQNTLGQMLA